MSRSHPSSPSMHLPPTAGGAHGAFQPSSQRPPMPPVSGSLSPHGAPRSPFEGQKPPGTASWAGHPSPQSGHLSTHMQQAPMTPSSPLAPHLAAAAGGHGQQAYHDAHSARSLSPSMFPPQHGASQQFHSPPPPTATQYPPIPSRSGSPQLARTEGGPTLPPSLPPGAFGPSGNYGAPPQPPASQMPCGNYGAPPQPPASQMHHMGGGYPYPQAPGSQGALSAKGSYPPMAPDINEYEHYYLDKKNHSYTVLLTVLGIITYAAMLSIPVISAAVMYNDPNYRFWVGTRGPLEMFFAAGFSLILLILTCACLYRNAFKETQKAGTVAHIICIFTSLLGIMMILITMPASKELYTISGRLSHGCSNTLPNSVTLMDYSIVLYNIRRQPACGKLPSIEECDGWASNQFTDYMRYVEQEFDCGPLCPDLPLFPKEMKPPGGNANVRAAAKNRNPLKPDWEFLEEEEGDQLSEAPPGVGDYVRLTSNMTDLKFNFIKTQHESHPGEPFVYKKLMTGMLGHLYRVLEVKEQGVVGLPSPDGSQGGVWYFPTKSLHAAHGPQGHGKLGPMKASAIKLFSHGVTTMSCIPLISTRLQVLAWGFGDMMFWEGVLMVILSIMAGAFNFCLVAIEKPPPKRV